MNTGQSARLASIGGRLAWIGMLVAVASAQAMATSGLGYRLGLWHFSTGFAMIGGAFWVGAGGAIMALLGLILSRGKPATILAIALLGVVVGGVVAYIPWSWKQALDSNPRIHDITTDVENPPAFVAVRRLRQPDNHPVEYDGAAVAMQQRMAFPDIVTQVVASDQNKAFAAAEAAIRSMGLEVVAANAAEGRIEATHTSLFYGFKDDVVVRVVADGSGARVDVRSKSRLGRSDLGQNARRVRTFIQELRANLS